MRPLALILAATLALPATAQTLTPRPAAPSEDLLARPDTYPGSDIELPAAAAAPGFRPATPGCIGAGLPEAGYGDEANCYTPGGDTVVREGIAVVPLD